MLNNEIKRLKEQNELKNEYLKENIRKEIKKYDSNCNN